MSGFLRRRTLFGAGLAAAAATATAGCTGDSRDTAEAFEPPVANDGSFALTGVRIFDGDDFVDADVVVVVDGEISLVGNGLDIPEGLPSADGAGRFLLPGLIDAHVHGPEVNAGPALRFGTTTMFDMGSTRARGICERMRDLREDRTQFGKADTWTAGAFVTVPGGHGTQFGDGPVIDDDTDVGAFIADRAAEGADFVKLIVESGSGEYPLPTLSADQVAATVDAAHEHGLLAVAHVGSWSDAAVAAAAGIDALAHVPSRGAIDLDVVETIVDSGVSVIATLAVKSATGCIHDSRELLDDEELAPYLDLSQQSAARRHKRNECYPEAFDQATESVAVLHQAGARILTGTDLNNPGVVAGVSMFLEMNLLRQTGLAQEATFAAATSAPADLLGLSDRGRVAPGMRADLLLVDGDLEEKAPEAADVAAVWKNGFPIEREVG